MMRFRIGDYVRIVSGSTRNSRSGVIINAHKRARGIDGLNEYQVLVAGFGCRICVENQLRPADHDNEPRAHARAA
jgi:hypothetical protein